MKHITTALFITCLLLFSLKTGQVLAESICPTVPLEEKDFMHWPSEEVCESPSFKVTKYTSDIKSSLTNFVIVTEISKAYKGVSLTITRWEYDVHGEYCRIETFVELGPMYPYPEAQPEDFEPEDQPEILYL